VLRSLYDKVSSTVDAQSVGREMFQSNALTQQELQSIQSKHSEPVKAAEQLLNIVMKQSDNVYSCFLDALKKTGHEDVFEVIVSDSCKLKGMYSTMSLLAFIPLFSFLLAYVLRGITAKSWSVSADMAGMVHSVSG